MLLSNKMEVAINSMFCKQGDNVFICICIPNVLSCCQKYAPPTRWQHVNHISTFFCSLKVNGWWICQRKPTTQMTIVMQQIRKGGTESKDCILQLKRMPWLCNWVLNARAMWSEGEGYSAKGGRSCVQLGHTHYQCNAIYSCKVQTMKLRTTEKKKGETICSCW